MKPIFYSPNLFKEFNDWLAKSDYSKLYFLVDENTHQDCLGIILPEIETDLKYEIIEIESGEEMKTIETCTHLWTILTEMEADRKSLLINLGGGVITDMGGFVASTYLRGIDFVNFPTSLLAMVDASVGGKTGVDLAHLKNRIGTFCNAQKVYIIPEFLKTLAQNEMISGYAEMLKHGLIADKNHFENLNELKEMSVDSISPLIEPSVMIKYKIVQEDPKEKGIRKILNFGHTIGHAIETYQLNIGNPILHGFAVAIGMYFESELAFKLGILNREDKDTAQKSIKKHYLIPSYNESEVREFIKLMYADKKNQDGKISFSLIDKIGHCQYDIWASEKDIHSAFFS